MQTSNFTYVIKQVEMALRPHFLAVCKQANLTPAQYTALSVLERRPGLTSSELARRSLVRAQTMAATSNPCSRRVSSVGNRIRRTAGGCCCTSPLSASNAWPRSRRASAPWKT